MQKSVVFTWGNIEGCNAMLHDRYVMFRFISALESWIEYAPSFRRVLYCDEETKDFLDKIGILGYLDEVFVLDFYEEIRKAGLDTRYWALPKVLTYKYVAYPAIVSDVDVFLLDGDIDDLTESWDSFAYDCYDNDAWYVYDREDLKSTYLGGSRSSVNAGFTWYKNPKYIQDIYENIVDTFHCLESNNTFKKISREIGRDSVISEIQMYVEEGTIGTYFCRHPEIKFKGGLGITNEYCQHVLNKGTAVVRNYNSILYWNSKIGNMFDSIEYGEDKVRL